MDLTKILSISGKPGLYKVLSQSRGGVVAISLLDGKKVSIGQTQRVSTLSDISIYVEDGDEPLAKVLEKSYERYNGELIDIELNDNESLRAFMSEVLPEHDEDRVYISDIKKVVKWYNLLHKNSLLDFSEEEPTEEEAAQEGAAQDPETADGDKKKEEAIAADNKTKTKKESTEVKKASKSTKADGPKAKATNSDKSKSSDKA